MGEYGMKFIVVDNQVSCDGYELTLECAEKLREQLDTAIGIVKTAHATSLKELGDSLLKRMITMQTRLNDAQGKAWTYHLSPICCKGQEWEDGSVKFWINTGRSTQIDGWRTQEEIEAFIKSDEKLVDTMGTMGT
jgi:hypothetical protein